MERHRAAVAKIATTVRSFFERQEPYRIFHGSTNSTRPATGRKGGSRSVDISALSRVLAVDATTRTALVEPNVPMDRLVEHTLRHGLVPPVVMEFPGITCGGGFAGTAGESSSFRHGFFDDTVRSVEIVLPDGEVVTARPDAAADNQHADLFRGAAGAVGTLGVTTLLELQLQPARRFVRTRYRRTHSVEEAVAAVREECARPENDYVDGILFSRDHGVVVSGQLTDEAETEATAATAAGNGETGEGEKLLVQTFSGAWDPWFYLHVQSRTAGLPSGAVAEELVPLAEYLFRYDRGGFWVGRAAFDYFKGLVPFTRATRWFLDDFLHTRMMYRALHGSGESARFVVQDIAMPFATTAPFVDYVANELAIWPLWLCPLRRRAPPTFHPFTTTPGKPSSSSSPSSGRTGTGTDEEEDEMMLNVGVWGWGPKSPAAFVAKNRELEAKVRELGGMKWLYAHTYYPESEFWPMYGGRAWYDALRAKYRAGALPSVWDKVHVDADAAAARDGKRPWLLNQWPVGGFYGLYKAIASRDYMLHRKAEWKWKGGE